MFDLHSRLGSRRFSAITTVLRMAAMLGTPFGDSYARRIVPLGKGRYYPDPHQGGGEIARRRRQIERGQLTASNGLCIHKGRRIIDVPFDMLNRGDRVWFSRAA